MEMPSSSFLFYRLSLSFKDFVSAGGFEMEQVFLKSVINLLVILLIRILVSSLKNFLRTEDF